MKNVSGGYFFSGRVVGIKPNYKCKCKFDEDGDIHNYTPSQLKSYTTKQTAVYNKNGKEGRRKNGSDEDDEVNNNNDNGANEPAGNEQEAGGDGESCVDSDTKEVFPLNGRCLNKLVHIGPGQSFQYRITKLKARNTSRDAFATMLSNPKKLVEGRFEQVELNVRPVQVFTYQTVSKVSEIKYALEAFYSRYDPDASTKSQMQKMPVISNFISSADHFRITEYTL